MSARPRIDPTKCWHRRSRSTKRAPTCTRCRRRLHLVEGSWYVWLKPDPRPRLRFAKFLLQLDLAAQPPERWEAM